MEERKFEKGSMQFMFMAEYYIFAGKYYEIEDTDEYYDGLDKDMQALWDKWRHKGDQRFRFFVLNTLKGFSEYVIMDNRSRRIPKGVKEG